MSTYNDLIEGLKILAKYGTKGLDRHGIQAEHDVIVSDVECVTEDEDDSIIHYADDVVSEEDCAHLINLGWHRDAEYGLWARFT